MLVKSKDELFLNDLNIMPFFEIKATSQDEIICDILKDGSCSKNMADGNVWDKALKIDYTKLRQYIQFTLNVNTMENKVSRAISTEFR